MPKIPKLSLQDALRSAVDGETAAAKPKSGRSATDAIGASDARPHRSGKVNVTGYFDSAVKQSLLMIRAKHPELTQQDLIAEALDLLFARHNVPQVARLSGKPES